MNPRTVVAQQTSAKTSKTKRPRNRYSRQVKENIKRNYRFCRTTADRRKLAADNNILDENGEPSVDKVYNLASRLGVAGSDTAVGELIPTPGEERPLIREDPETLKLNRSDEAYLRQEFGRRAISDIAAHLSHSETALAYFARKMGLRKPVRYWDIEKVSGWMGMDLSEFRALKDEGLDIYPLGNRRGRLCLEVVSTSSLGRWLAVKKNLKRIRDRGADEFFILEIQESLADLIAEKTEFESCIFLSHGHVCMNPATDLSFGLFCTNNDRYKAGEDPICRAKTLAIEDLKPTIPDSDRS